MSSASISYSPAALRFRFSRLTSFDLAFLPFLVFLALLIFSFALPQEGKNAARDWARTVTGIIKPYSNESLRYADMVTDNVEKDQAGMWGSEKRGRG